MTMSWSASKRPEAWASCRLSICSSVRPARRLYSEEMSMQNSQPTIEAARRTLSSASSFGTWEVCSAARL